MILSWVSAPKNHNYLHSAKRRLQLLHPEPIAGNRLKSDWGQGVAGSNPVIPTISFPPGHTGDTRRRPLDASVLDLLHDVHR